MWVDELGLDELGIFTAFSQQLLEMRAGETAGIRICTVVAGTDFFFTRAVFCQNRSFLMSWSFTNQVLGQIYLLRYCDPRRAGTMSTSCRNSSVQFLLILVLVCSLPNVTLVAIVSVVSETHGSTTLRALRIER